MTHAQAPLSGKWVAVFQKLDNGRDNKLFLELHQDGTTLKGHFHTVGYGGDLSGTIENGHFVLFAPWDKIKPFRTGEVSDVNSQSISAGAPLSLSSPKRQQMCPHHLFTLLLPCCTKCRRMASRRYAHGLE
jgi:hypothetical protein